MVKLKDYYMLKKMSKVETKGVRFELGDFVIKIGSVIMGGSIFKGILVEVRGLLRSFFFQFIELDTIKPR